jgi:hypothetical protein
MRVDNNKRPLAVLVTQLLLIIIATLMALSIIALLIRAGTAFIGSVANWINIGFMLFFLVTLWGLTKRKTYGKWLGLLFLTSLWILILWLQKASKTVPWIYYEQYDLTKFIGAVIIQGLSNGLFLYLIVSFLLSPKIADFFRSDSKIISDDESTRVTGNDGKEETETTISWEATGLIVSLIFLITWYILFFERSFSAQHKLSTSFRPVFQPEADNVAGVLILIFPFVVASTTFFFVRYVILRKRRNAPTLNELLADRSAEAPVLYLRSFCDDAKAAKVMGWTTEEDQLAIVFNKIGPFIAIGRPGEELPELGAARIYVGDDEWQDTITDLMSKAHLVVLRIGETPGFWWEVKRAIQLVNPERLLLLVPRDKKMYEGFRQKANEYFPHPLPKYERGISHLGRLKGIIFFRPDWTAHLIKFQMNFRELNLNAPIVPRLSKALLPIFIQLEVNWEPPRGNLIPKKAILLCFLFLLALLMFIAPLLLFTSFK